MAVTYGFYNSLNGDRKYNALQLSMLFDGLIEDGVFNSIGERFALTAGSGNTVNVGTGRAWFNHSWTYNDAELPMSLDDSEVVLNRYDAIVIEINGNTESRKNDIKVIKGSPASNPSKPSMTKEGNVFQYPLGYIYRKAGASEITQADIEYVVGQSECPYVIGAVQKTDIDALVAQWQSEFDQWFEDAKNTLGEDTAGELLNKINDLTSKTIGKTLKTLDEVKIATEEGHYVDALAVKEAVQSYVYENDGMKLVRYGPIVTCTRKSISDEVPGSHLYQNTFLKKIPDGYKPNGGAWGNIAVVTGNTVVDYMYINIDTNGETYQIAKNGYSGRAEYNICMTWNTVDPIPKTS